MEMPVPSPCPLCAGTDCAFYGEQDGYRLYRCGRCSALAVWPMPSDEQIAAFYQSYHKTAQYTGKLDSKLRRAKRRIRILRRRTPRRPGRRLLDVGCNAGFATEAARQLGFDALGVDIDGASIEAARGLFPRARFQVADVAALADGGQRFDAVYCSEVVEHLPRPVAFLSALRRCLRPGGRALLTTPDVGHRSLPSDLIGTDMIRPPEHLLYFNRRSAQEALTASGFTNVYFLTTFKPTLKILAW